MEIKNITVLGSGIMGHGIAQVSAMAGYNIVLRDIEQQFLDKAMGKIKWSLDKLVSKEKISEKQRDEIFSRIKPIVDLNDAVHDSDLVIEAVPEIMDLKKKVYAELDKVANERVIFASNTSTLPITEIADTISRPEKFIGIHFFNPPQLMKLVEVIPGQKSGEGFYKYSDDKYERIQLSEKLAQKCNPTQIIANILNNAAWLVTNNASDIDEIEKAANLGLGLKKPLFDTAKEIGMQKIVEELKKLSNKHGTFYEPDPLLLSMC